MNKFCSILGILILGIFNICSGCSSCKGGRNGGGKGVSSKNKKGKSMKGKKPKSEKNNGKEEEEKDGEEENEEEGKKEGGEEGDEEGGEGEELKEENKKELINKISGFINDSSAYNNKELYQFDVNINDDNKIEITFEGDHFKATSVENWNEIKEDPESATFTISFKTNNNKDDLYWKFKNENKISLKNLRKSLAKIDDKYRENRKSHYLCVKDETNVLQSGDDCHIDLSDGIVYIAVNVINDDAIRLHVCNVRGENEEVNGYTYLSSAGYYDGKYTAKIKGKFVDDNHGTAFKNYRAERSIPSEEFLNRIGNLTIVTE